jgi:hypothetical protein
MPCLRYQLSRSLTVRWYLQQSFHIEIVSVCKYTIWPLYRLLIWSRDEMGDDNWNKKTSSERDHFLWTAKNIGHLDLSECIIIYRDKLWIEVCGVTSLKSWQKELEESRYKYYYIISSLLSCSIHIQESLYHFVTCIHHYDGPVIIYLPKTAYCGPEND